MSKVIGIQACFGPWASLGVHVDFRGKFVNLHILWWIITLSVPGLSGDSCPSMGIDIYSRGIVHVEDWRGPWVSLGASVDFQARFVVLHVIWWIITIGTPYHLRKQR